MSTESTGLRPVNQDRAGWRVSSYTQSNGTCVEVKDGVPGRMPVRDSKRRTGPVLDFDAGAWKTFVAGIKAGEFPF